jgi:hypothetical protein
LIEQARFERLDKHATHHSRDLARGDSVFERDAHEWLH